MAFEALAEAAERWCARTPFQLIAAEETERRMDFYAEPGVSFYVLCPEPACGDNFVSAPPRDRPRPSGGASGRSPRAVRAVLGGAPGRQRRGAGGMRGWRAAGPGSGGILPSARHRLQNGVRCRRGRPHGQAAGRDTPGRAPGQAAGSGGQEGCEPLGAAPAALEGCSCPCPHGPSIVPGARRRAGHGQWRTGRNKMESG